MTKKKTSAAEEQAEQEDAAELEKFVVLHRISYKSMIPEEQRYIDPYVNEEGQIDPYHPDAPRITLEHLSKSDINLVLLRGAVARDKPQGD